MYLARKDDAKSAKLEWRMDFSMCGLVATSMEVKMRQSRSEARHSDYLTISVKGDDGFLLEPQEEGTIYTTLFEVFICCYSAGLAKMVICLTENGLLRKCTSTNTQHNANSIFNCFIMH